MAQPYVDDLLATVDRACDELRTVDPAVVAWRPAPGHWSAKEIIGHLIDSAANNHQRFVRARWQDDLIFAGYRQDDWVDSQDYQSAEWDDLLVLWRQYNRHLARVMAGTPPAILRRLHARHNLDEIAWRTVPVTQPATLEYFMSDYVGHLHHHLAQLRERLDAATAR
jgi:hypothetical protein